jgi:hypothetical protein
MLTSVPRANPYSGPRNVRIAAIGRAKMTQVAVANALNAERIKKTHRS